nr:hypothetical protein [Streptomyces sp. SID12501]
MEWISGWPGVFPQRPGGAVQEIRQDGHCGMAEQIDKTDLSAVLVLAERRPHGQQAEGVSAQVEETVVDADELL